MQLSHEYVAGLFDGEGWVSFSRFVNKSRKRGKRAYRFQLYIGLVMREENIIEALRAKYGGTVLTQLSKKVGHSTTYRWVICGRNAQFFIENVLLPYSIAKNKHAQIALRICSLKQRQGVRSQTDEEYTENITLWEEMQRLNQKGIGKG